MVVIDASVLVAYASSDERAETAAHVVRGGRGQMVAPHLIDAEVGHSLRRLEAAGAISSGAAASFLDDLPDLPLQRSPHTFLLGTAWAMRSKLSFYDALYLALGKLLEIPVVTFDRGLAGAGAGFGVEAELLS